MANGPSDKDLERLLGEEYGATPGEVASGAHQAREDMQSDGWMNQSATNKYLEQYPEDKQGEWYLIFILV